MRRPQMRLRTWMFLVFVTALVLARGQWGKKMEGTYRVKALYHAAQEMNSRVCLVIMRSPPPPRVPEVRAISRLMNAMASTPRSKDLLTTWGGPPIVLEMPPIAGEPLFDPRREAAALTEKIDYHLRLRRKYEWLAQLPWLPVWPDPPEPR